MKRPLVMLRKLRASKARAVKEGGGSDAPLLGLVTRTPVSGEPAPCHYCGIVDGHRADCPVIS